MAQQKALISKLRHRLRFQTSSQVRDAHGGYALSWADSFTSWGAIEPLNGREYLEAQSINESISYRFRIRWRSGVDSDMRIIDTDGLIYRIESVIHDKHARRELIIMAVQNEDESE